MAKKFVIKVLAVLFIYSGRAERMIRKGKMSLEKLKKLGAEVHFSDTSTQNIEDKLKRVILHDLEHGKQSRSRKSDEKALDKLQQAPRQETACTAATELKSGCTNTYRQFSLQ